jgi:FkbM family methyltransferase
MLYLPEDRYIGKGLDLYGEFSEGEVEVFRDFIKPDWTVLDIGANHGSHTVFFGKTAKVVHAFEPQRILHQILCANVALNALTNVHTYQVAVGREAGSTNVPLVDYTQNNNFGAIPMGDTGEPVSLVTIDSLNLDCQFMKIDVEGMECAVIDGASATIRRCQPVIYTENDHNNSGPLIEKLLSLNYQCYWHLPTYFNRDNYRGKTDSIWGNQVSVNMLCVPANWHGWDLSRIHGFRRINSPKDTWNGK